jgi:hypothetical protein
MRSFWRIQRAELAKVGRSASVLVLVLSPYLVVLAVTLFAGVQGARFLPQATQTPWRWLGNAALDVWCLLVLPVASALALAHLAGLEHRAQGWKHLFALPVPRWQIYLAKQTTALLGIAASFVLLGLGVLAGGLVLRVTSPVLGFAQPIPWGHFAGSYLSAFAACPFFLAIQQWVSLERKDFTGPLGVAFLALAGFLVLRAAGGSEFEAFHPWAYPSLAAAAWIDGGGLLWLHPLLGTLGGLLFGIAAGAAYVRRDVQ